MNAGCLNTVVFNLHQTKRRAFLGHPVAVCTSHDITYFFIQQNPDALS